MKFYIQESTGSHRSQAAGDVPEGFTEATEEEYNAFVESADQAAEQAKAEARTAKQAACDELCTKLVEVTGLPMATVTLALGVPHEAS